MNNTSRIVCSMAMSAALAGTMVVQASFAQQSDYAPRKWTSNNGQHSVRAAFVSIDEETKTITLFTDDSTTIEVKLDQLCSTDKRYIARQLQKLAADSKVEKTDEAESPFIESNGNDSTQKSRNKTSIRSGDTKLLYGIRWQTGFPETYALASGKTTPKDDKPIMWFRVLGDLEGFM